MKIWKNTKTLDDYSEGLEFTEDKNEAEIALLGGKTLDLTEFPKLKAIFRAGVSRNNVPEELAKQRNIICRYPADETVEFINEETANFTCGLIFRMMYENKGTLNPWVKFDRDAFHSKKLLVIGQGKIGSKVSNKMMNFMEVMTFDILTSDADQLDQMIGAADCICLHIPMSEQNRGFFDKEKLSLMKDGAVLINTARGPLVNEEALYNEMSTNRLSAAFDVFWEEPYNGRLVELHPYPFFMTPHIASTCSGFLQGCISDLKELINEITD